MSHLVAFFGNEPENLSCALFFARNALHTRERVEGWALGFVQGGDVLLQKRPRANASGVDFYALSRDLKADALIGRVGLGAEGNRAVENADPFRFRSWLFGTLGDIPGFQAVRERVLELTPDFLRRNIRGQCAAEHLFHLFLANLHAGGILDAPSPDPRRVHVALEDALRQVTTLIDGLGPAARGGRHGVELAAVVTNGRCLVTLNRACTLQFLRVDGVADCPVCHDRVHAHSEGRRISHEGLRAIVIEADSKMQGRPGWRSIPDGSALIAGPDRIPHLISPEV